MQSDKGDAAVERVDWADIAASSLHWLARDGHDRECWAQQKRYNGGGGGCGDDAWCLYWGLHRRRSQLAVFTLYSLLFI